jgi:hypothetical protein
LIELEEGRSLAHTPQEISDTRASSNSLGRDFSKFHQNQGQFNYEANDINITK